MQVGALALGSNKVRIMNGGLSLTVSDQSVAEVQSLFGLSDASL